MRVGLWLAQVEQARLDRDKAQVKETQGRRYDPSAGSRARLQLRHPRVGPCEFMCLVGATREIARLLERCKVESAEAARQQNEAVTALRSRMEAQLNKRNKELQSMSMKVRRCELQCDCNLPRPPPPY